MSSKLLTKQLENSEIFDTAIYDKSSDSYFIPKATFIRPEKYHSYLVELDDSLLINNGDTITQFNWNKGQVPTQKYYKIDVENIMGKMILCTGIGYDINLKTDLNVFWHGYLPKNKLKFMEEI